MSKTTKSLYVIALLLFFVAGLLMAKYNPWSENNAQASGYGGLGGDFTLQSNQGEVNLSDFRGKLVLMYFGFTSCPDVCPTSLSSMAASMRELAPEQEAMIQPLFVSVDPDRDTLENIALYSEYFHPTMLGLTGTKETIDKVVKDYGSYYTFIPLENSSLTYTVDHTSRIYLIDQQGQLVSTLGHGTSVDEITEALKALL